jgi:hypothetical protein
MDSIGLAIALVTTALGAYAIWVGIRVAGADFYSPAQKVTQLVIVLLVPLFGAVLVHALLKSHSAPVARDDTRFVADRRDDTATGPHVRTADDA